MWRICTQAVSLFIVDNERPDTDPSEDFPYTYSHLKELDPVAANRIHPNDQRKVIDFLK